MVAATLVLVVWGTLVLVAVDGWVVLMIAVAVLAI